LERQEENGTEAALPAELRALLHWGRVLGHGAPTARLPFNLRIR